ncbi:unnamed protein product [Brassica rapa subsp. trilocularis]
MKRVTMVPAVSSNEIIVSSSVIFVSRFYKKPIIILTSLAFDHLYSTGSASIRRAQFVLQPNMGVSRNLKV